MKRMKVLEMGSAALFLACFLRTCCIEDDGKTGKDYQAEFFSTNFEDKVISIVRTRRLYSYDPILWENPRLKQDEGIWIDYAWVSMSNLYSIVVIDSNVDEWVFKRKAAKCRYFDKEAMPKIGSFCVYSAKNDTLVQYDGGPLAMAKVVDLEGLFNYHKSCPCIYFGNRKNGVLFWRTGLDQLWCGSFMRLLCAGRPVECYTVKKFKTWNDFLSWDGNLAEEAHAARK